MWGVTYEHLFYTFRFSLEPSFGKLATAGPSAMQLDAGSADKLYVNHIEGADLCLESRTERQERIPTEELYHVFLLWHLQACFSASLG